MNRVLICDSLLRRNETEPFLKKLITGDEKWITYDKNMRKRSWSKAGQASQTVAKPGLTRNKVMLCVWWDWKGIIHYELLPPGRTIDSELYCEQLMRLKQKVERKRPELINRRGMVFHHDNARVHTSLATQQKLREFGWEVLMHLPYKIYHARNRTQSLYVPSGLSRLSLSLLNDRTVNNYVELLLKCLKNSQNVSKSVSISIENHRNFIKNLCIERNT
ncbi:hypothetical protein K1T71_007976 [Dendrolimus kikuchii]|uniref:Uncharacterized protein n=1 Tax=Dendrolimus kikuchii TaxID=765133 RepID=A0ACC1D082_9NEOP|nr:hypothetical protein K1T71_007976 [Dendrolimus kikuchii]